MFNPTYEQIKVLKKLANDYPKPVRTARTTGNREVSGKVATDLSKQGLISLNGVRPNRFAKLTESGIIYVKKRWGV